jgi:hypothetical protein
MKYLLITIFLLFLALPVYAVRFDWVLGQPAEILNSSTDTTSDAIWWVLGQPSVVASTTITEGGAPPVTLASELQPQVIIIISENFIKTYA